MKHINQCSSLNTNVIDDVSGEMDISNYWKDHFYKILNANVSNHEFKCSIMDKLDDVKYVEAMVV